MKKPPLQFKSTVPLIAAFGCIIYLILYIIAASFYPGGSNFNKASIGYHWNENYWCELLAPFAKNGQVNSARPVAFAAMAVMVISVSICWYYLPVILHHKYRIVTIRYCGLTAMLVILFLPFGYHDTVINIAAMFTVVALLSTFVGLYRNGYHTLLLLGITCFVFATTNKLVYEIHPHTKFLPVIQELTFLSFLLWFGLLARKIYWSVNFKN